MPYVNQGSASTQIGTFNDVAGDQVNNYKYNYINSQQDAKEQLRPFAAVDARYDSLARDPADRCHPRTRLAVLNDIEGWVKGNHPKERIYWLHGAPLLGKSSISQSVAERCQDLGRLAASVFYSSCDANRDKLRSLFLTITYQLCLISKMRNRDIGNIIKKDPTLIYKSPAKQLESLIVNQFSKSTSEKDVIVIDAIDESIGDTGNMEILLVYLDLIRQASLNTPFRFFITCRMSFPLQEFATKHSQTVKLVDLSAYDTAADIRVFYDSRLNSLRDDFKEGTDWATSDQVQTLASNADGLFIYPVAILKYVHSNGRPGHRLRLERALGNDAACTEGIWSRLDGLYAMVLSHIPWDHYTKYIKPTITTLCLLYYAFRLPALKTILGFTEDAWGILQDLHAFFHIPSKTDSDTCVRLVHCYFRTWICDPKRSGKYAVDSRKGHSHLAGLCLKQMISGLSSNMFHMADGETVANILVEDKRAKFVSRVLEYSCRCWLYHLYDGLADEDALPPLVEKFSRYPILHWVELMGLLRRMEEVVTALNRLSKLNQILGTTVHERVVVILDFVDLNLDRIVPSPAYIYNILGVSPLFIELDPEAEAPPSPATKVNAEELVPTFGQIHDSTLIKFTPTTVPSDEIQHSEAVPSPLVDVVMFHTPTINSFNDVSDPSGGPLTIIAETCTVTSNMEDSQLSGTSSSPLVEVGITLLESPTARERRISLIFQQHSRNSNQQLYSGWQRSDYGWCILLSNGDSGPKGQQSPPTIIRFTKSQTKFCQVTLLVSHLLPADLGLTCLNFHCCTEFYLYSTQTPQRILYATIDITTCV